MADHFYCNCRFFIARFSALVFFLVLTLGGLGWLESTPSVVKREPTESMPHWIVCLAQSRNFHKHDDLIWEAAYTHDLDPDLWKAVIMVESAGNPKAKSKRGARGLSQLMPQTAAHMGLKAHQHFDPQANLNAGARYLSFLLKEYDGDLSLALAAYNAGPTIVTRTRQVPRFGETQRFVQSVLTLRHWLKNESLTRYRAVAGKAQRPKTKASIFM